MSNWWEKNKGPISEWQALRTPEGLDYYYNTVTGETTWDKPDALKTESELSAAGDWVWCPDEKDCFVPARMQGRQGNQAVLQDQRGQSHYVAANVKLEPLKLSSLQRIVSDLVLLDNMGVPLILHCLRKRFENHDIYTNVGTILISINPYCSLGLYTPEKIYEYQYRGLKEMPPHVFNIAHEAYKGLCDFKENQSIIISGESGAGKTEATKQCLSYLASIAGSVGGVEKKVLQANPILEAFGNAKTLRNDNSSRFGKYMEVTFNDKNQIVGSVTTNYLLEKIRVVQQQQNERNFHVFYQLTKSANQGQRRDFSLGQPTDYAYLAMSNCINVDSIDDGRDFKDMQGALAELLFTQQEAAWLFTIVSSILALGNIEFRGGKTAGSQIPDMAWANVAAGLLGVAPKDMAKALTNRELRIKGQQSTTVPLSSKEAGDTRDALAKFIYTKMFDWIVVKVNRAMGNVGEGRPGGGKMSIGILDIFGFEIFQQNSFEQLCINFTNEMLQQHFNNQTFKLEEQVYKQEQIQFKHIEFIDNQPVLDLIMKKPAGIIPMLDEELVMPKGSDQTFLQKLHLQYKGNKYFSGVLSNPNNFVINHYAGVVTYDAIGFLEKNRDTLTDDLLEMLWTSKMQLISLLFPKEQKMTTQEKKASLGKQFTQQLLDLMAALNKTNPHYIRCVKPNDEKSPSTFVPRNCLDQLTYSGVFEAVAIRKQGFPFRLAHGVFFDHYKCLLANAAAANDKKKGCMQICGEMKLNKTNVQMGVSMVLYRSEEHKMLELQRSIKMVAIEMQETLTRLCNTDISKMNAQQKERYFEELSRAVRKADEFRLTTPISERARQLLDDFIESRMDAKTKQMLERAKQTCDVRLMEEVLGICDSQQYNTRLVKEVRRMYQRACRILEEADKYSVTMEETPVRVVVQAADEIGLQGEWVNYFRELVNGDPMHFLDAQFKAAQENKNDARAIRVDIKRKDLLCQRDGPTYELRNFRRLKDATAWAGEKFFGNKEEMAAHFLTWQDHLIHAPLLRYDNITDKDQQKEIRKKCKVAFKYIMKYMGQRKTKVLLDRGRQVVVDGLQTPQIRDEIYVGLIKQLTNNPEAEAVRKGWDMMGLCLTTFPPSPDFENFLEVFLRKPHGGNIQYKYTGWLRKRVYEGAVATPPTIEQMEHVEQTLGSRARGFSEPLPEAQPSYQDLMTPFGSMEPIQQTYERATPKKQGGGGGGGAKKQQGGGGGGGGGGVKKAGAKGAPAKAAPAPAKKNPWIACVDDQSGDTYYYNEETGESTWEMPPAMMYDGRSSVAARGW